MVPLFTSSSSILKRRAMCVVHGLYLRFLAHHANAPELFKLRRIDEYCSLKDSSYSRFRGRQYRGVLSWQDTAALPPVLGIDRSCLLPAAR